MALQERVEPHSPRRGTFLALSNDGVRTSGGIDPQRGERHVAVDYNMSHALRMFRRVAPSGMSSYEYGSTTRSGLIAELSDLRRYAEFFKREKPRSVVEWGRMLDCYTRYLQLVALLREI
ncbi:hypothetical protein B0H11DRAFT_2259133 [Mycena galericulata]|nr:hypothetical protein B0H11DRAFT_2259133 [Mycena galericulata]